MLSKEKLLRTLPLHDGDLAIRACERGDLDAFAEWPPYPFPHESFGFSFAGMSAQERDTVFEARNGDPRRVSLAIDHDTQPCVASLVLFNIDWPRRTAGNMGYRVAPDRCDRGMGTRILHTTAAWLFGQGMDRLRLDVAASNARAVRCYEKAGFERTAEFWIDEPALQGVDLAQERYAFLRDHVRLEGAHTQIRFWWMELSATRFRS